MPKINWKQCLAWMAVADGEKYWSSTTFIDKHWWIGAGRPHGQVRWRLELEVRITMVLKFSNH
jgi:hypothetical protein